ncbi:MAG: DNA polymerase IV [Sporichthyaceae bacterium]
MIMHSACVLHVDLDQFLAAIEILRRPELRGLPVVVGGDGDPTKRGVVSTASYEARAFGVHSGVPLRTAFKRCPDAVFLPVDKEAYDTASTEVMAALRSFGFPVDVLGWDEAFLGVETDDPEALARQIQDRVRAATGLDCSVGIGQNTQQAKLATEFGKPAGVFRLTYDTWFEVLGDKPTDALWGIGRRLSQRLADVGITTVKELAAADPETLKGPFGPSTGPWLVNLGNGHGSRTITDRPYVARGKSREVTFQENIEDWDEVRRQLEVVARRVAADVAAEDRLVVRVTVKVRFAPFFSSTHGQQLNQTSADPDVVTEAALAALEKFTDRRPVRLLGVRAELTAPDLAD